MLWPVCVFGCECGVCVVGWCCKLFNGISGAGVALVLFLNLEVFVSTSVDGWVEREDRLFREGLLPVRHFWGVEAPSLLPVPGELNISWSHGLSYFFDSLGDDTPSVLGLLLELTFRECVPAFGFGWFFDEGLLYVAPFDESFEDAAVSPFDLTVLQGVADLCLVRYAALFDRLVGAGVAVAC